MKQKLKATMIDLLIGGAMASIIGGLFVWALVA